MFQGNAGRYAILTKGSFKYSGDIDLSEYYIISTKIADANGPLISHPMREWEVQVLESKAIAAKLLIFLG